MAPRVFITQPAIHKDAQGTSFAADYAPAECYGELVYVVNSRPMIMDGQELARIEHNLRDFSRDDYLLLSGDPLVCALCAIAAARMTYGFVRMLRYDKRTGRYTEFVAHF